MGGSSHQEFSGSLKSNEQVSNARINLNADLSDTTFNSHQGTLTMQNDSLLYSAVSPMGHVVNVYPACKTGACNCGYFIGDVVKALSLKMALSLKNVNLNFET